MKLGDLVTVPEAARRLGMSSQRLGQLIRRGTCLAAVTVAGRRYVQRQAVEGLIRRRANMRRRYRPPGA